MKKIRPFFPIISIVLSIAGLCGAVLTFWLSVLSFKNGEVLKTMAVLILIFGLAWSIAAVIAGISSFRQANKIIALQRNVNQNRLDPRYSKTAKQAYRARINFKQCRVRSILIVLICVVQMIFICIVGVKIGQISMLALCGIVVPFVFLASAKSNS
ncbi:MAG: hypothetical protein MJ086_03030 [Lachnospiraceae bacterium]|nr:hypothetical protein [Lachnospiraceae bacterium]